MNIWIPGLPDVLSNRPCRTFHPIAVGQLACLYASQGLGYFGPQVYSKGSLVIALVRVCVSIFRYLREGSLVFLKLCMKLGVDKVKKVTRLKF